MKRVPLWYPFALALIFTFYGTILLPDTRLVTFSPFFAIVFERNTYVKSLWIATICGLIMDIFSSQMHFGIYAVCYGITAAICYQQKKHFFEDKPIALSLFSALISAISSLILIALTILFDKQFPITFEVVLSDGLITPILDALYAFVWFTMPIKVYLYLGSGKWKKYFEKREENS